MSDFPNARTVESNVLIYDAEHVRASSKTCETRLSLQAELARALLDGPGVVLIEGAFDPSVVDRATAIFTALIDEEIASREEPRRPLRQAGDERPSLEFAEQAGRP